MLPYLAFLPHPPLLIPEIGQQDDLVAKTFAAQNLIAKDILALEKKTDILIVMSPHAPADRKHIPIYSAKQYTGDFGAFQHSAIVENFSGSPVFVKELVKAVSGTVPVAAYESPLLDHGVLVPLYSLYKLGYAKPICVLGISYEAEEHYRFGVALADFAKTAQKNIIFVGSGDMSHALKDSGPYAFNPAGPQFDNRVVEAIRSGQESKILDFSENFVNAAAECGYRSLLTIAGIRSKVPELQPEVLSYEGPYGVGYLTARWSK